MRQLYLALAIIGAVLPYSFFVRHFASEGLSLTRFVAALFANPAAGGFTADLLLTSFVFWLYMFRRHAEGRGPNPALFVVLNLAIGLSCAFPAYLYASARDRQRWRERGGSGSETSG